MRLAHAALVFVLFCAQRSITAAHIVQLPVLSSACYCALMRTVAHSPCISPNADRSSTAHTNHCNLIAIVLLLLLLLTGHAGLLKTRAPQGAQA
jgi:hypothetical protein